MVLEDEAYRSNQHLIPRRMCSQSLMLMFRAFCDASAERDGAVWVRLLQGSLHLRVVRPEQRRVETGNACQDFQQMRLDSVHHESPRLQWVSLSSRSDRFDCYDDVGPDVNASF